VRCHKVVPKKEGIAVKVLPFSSFLALMLIDYVMPKVIMRAYPLFEGMQCCRQ